MADETPSFVNKLASANTVSICNASAESVGRKPMRQVLQRHLAVPLFQRRYCWGPPQWETLLADVERMTEAPSENNRLHWLGRLTCTHTLTNSRTQIIDGQQRTTSTLLMLAAIRDVAATVGKEVAARELVNELDNIIFPNTEELDNWILGATRDTDGMTWIPEGQVLSFARLLPTYCDRASFYAAALPMRARATSSGEWSRPSEAKRWFLAAMQGRRVEDLSRLAAALLDRVDMLVFPVTVGTGRQDGTEDLQVIYERLAIRDATLCRPHRSTEYADMGAADFVRNLLLGSFGSEKTAIYLYRSTWLPLERAAAEAAERSRSNVALGLERMLERFLKAYPLPAQTATLQGAGPSRNTVVVGGAVYSSFRKWLSEAPSAFSWTTTSGYDFLPEEQWTVGLLSELCAFGIEYFKAV